MPAEGLEHHVCALVQRLSRPCKRAEPAAQPSVVTCTTAYGCPANSEPGSPAP